MAVVTRQWSCPGGVRAGAVRLGRWGRRHRLGLAAVGWATIAVDHPAAGGYLLCGLLILLAPTYLQIRRRRPGPARDASDLTDLTVDRLQRQWDTDGGGAR